MDEQEATGYAQGWRGSRGLVPRGPKWVLGWRPASRWDVERHTGRRPPVGADLWRLDVGGRFLRSGGLVYPGGIPFPEELQHQTAVITSEVWLYVDRRAGGILGIHWWPEAIRRPVASVPQADLAGDQLLHPADAAGLLDVDLRLPAHPRWDPALVARTGPGAVLVLLVRELIPEPLNEMLLFEEGGLSLRIEMSPEPPDTREILRVHQPPFRAVRAARLDAVGRDLGHTLGPQTWPWPAELQWWEAGIAYELKGFEPLGTLQEVAASLAPLPS